jgi:hypothetical protein
MAARESFVYAMSRASLVTAAVALVGALLAWRFLPARAAVKPELDVVVVAPEHALGSGSELVEAS